MVGNSLNKPLGLKRTEKSVWNAFRSGRQIDLRPNGKAARNGRLATRGAVVRAEVIAAMLSADPGPGNNTHLTIRGLRITGPLDLSYARIEYPITLRECFFDQPIVLAEAQLDALTLDSSSFPGIEAPHLEVNSDLGLSYVRSYRTVNLTGAHFHRDVRLGGARLSHGDDQEVALAADRMVVDGSVTCDGGFEAAGTVTMAGARVNGALRLDGAKITADGQQKVAFYGDRMTVGDYLSAEGLGTEGEVRLVDVRIASTLEFRGAMLVNDDGVALRLDRAEILSSLYCDNGFTVAGDMTAIDTHVRGSAYLNNAELGRPVPTSGAAGPGETGVALRLKNAKIDGDLGCWVRFVAHGKIDLSGLSVAGEFTLVTTELRGYPEAADFTNGRFTALAISGDPPAGFLDFTDANTDFFRDGPALQERGAIILDGFEYRTIQMTNITVEQRVQWLRRAMVARCLKPDSGGFLPQPYEQLAKVYRRVGNEEAAERIGLARESAHYRARSWPVKICGWIYGITLGYGYRLRRAFLLLPVLYFLSLLIVHVAQNSNAFVPVEAHTGQIVAAAHCTSAYPCFSQWAYPVDWVVPFINLHQTEYWQPDAHKAIGNATRDWLYVTTILGWAAATLLVGAFAGLARKD